MASYFSKWIHHFDIEGGENNSCQCGYKHSQFVEHSCQKTCQCDTRGLGERGNKMSTRRCQLFSLIYCYQTL